MISPGTALDGFYDDRLVTLSVFIAILAAGAALDLAGRVTSARGVARRAWLGGGAFAMGTGIWYMHYIGMLAFHLPVPVLYDWPTVLASSGSCMGPSLQSVHACARPGADRTQSSDARRTRHRQNRKVVGQSVARARAHRP